MISFVSCFAVLLSALFSSGVKPPEQGGQHTESSASCGTLLVKSGDLGDRGYTAWGPKVSCCPLVAKGRYGSLKDSKKGLMTHRTALNAEVGGTCGSGAVEAGERS